MLISMIKLCSLNAYVISLISLTLICAYFFFIIHKTINARHFPHSLQLNLDETCYCACSSLVSDIDHYVSQQNTYIAYQLLLTATMLITIKEESYLTI